MEKQTLFNRTVNQKLTNVNNILHSNLFLSLDDAAKVKFYTGLPSMEIFEHVFNMVEGSVDRNGTKLTKKQEFIIVMMRLRLGLLEQDLAYRFSVAQSRISRIVSMWISVMVSRLSFLIHRPEREQLLKTMPSCFLDNFKQCVIILTVLKCPLRSQMISLPEHKHTPRTSTITQSRFCWESLLKEQYRSYVSLGEGVHQMSILRKIQVFSRS